MRRGAGVVLLGLSACGGGGGNVPARSLPPPPPGVVESDWRRLATPADRDRLRRWRDAWVTALGSARRRAAAEIAAQGPLFALDAALPGPVPPAGAYRCRVFKLGAKGAGMLDYVAYPWFDCLVSPGAGGDARLAKLSGSQRQIGTIHPADGMRAAFLGTLMLGDETRPFAYGRDRSRDVAGWVERVGARRWRLAMPYPAFESTLDVLELVPAG
ncbi:MAG: DUF4893 domain-containing protein [Sphingomonas taxi]|uniref:DUF4893 domain-containing protein n=1 Tax=Sphingomonas taxi TaxID=1549858 RepID=A0A2W5QXT0_9SPHN|nr:MAG: DUF4893 domain-containing protein [Sphingomonas taxi]